MASERPAPEPDGVYLDSTTFELIKQYRDAVKAITMWDRLRADVRDQLVKIMDGNAYGHYYGRRILTVTRSRPRRFDQSAFAADNPGLYEQYRVTPDHDEVRLILARDLPGDPAGEGDG